MRVHTFLEVMQYELTGKAEVEYRQTGLVGKNQAAFSGEYDQDTDTIHLYLLASSLKGKLTKAQTRELEYEAYKARFHEQVHRDQHRRNIDIGHPLDASRADYLLHPAEVEAYSRVDIPNDLRRYQFSLDLLEYAKILALTPNMMKLERGLTAYSIMCYYQLPIDEYMEEIDTKQRGIEDDCIH